jgi:uncharacterized protein (TIGR03067 family)
MRALGVGVVLLAVVGAGVAQDAKKEMAQLEGEWTMVSGERDGQSVPDEMRKTAKRIVKDAETTVEIGGQLFMKAKFAIDPAKKPKTIDYTVIGGANDGKKVLGIYEVDGDTVKFCFALPDKDRPTEFTAKEGSGWTLSVWKRAKK